MKKAALLFFLTIWIGTTPTYAQKIHSHNDYEQNVPFWKAFAAGASSIEADVFLINDTLYVAHEKNEIKATRTLENLYLKPIQVLFEKELMDTRPFQLLIDIKTEAHPTLNKIVDTLNPLQKHLYPINPDGVQIIISGSRPNSTEYSNFPEYIYFDWQSTDVPQHKEKVALVSLSLSNFTQWTGERPLTQKEKNEVTAIIGKMKKLNKPIRFWASPDTPLAWETLHKLGVDFIGTDMPNAACLFFEKDRK